MESSLLKNIFPWDILQGHFNYDLCSILLFAVTWNPHSSFVKTTGSFLQATFFIFIEGIDCGYLGRSNLGQHQCSKQYSKHMFTSFGTHYSWFYITYCEIMHQQLCFVLYLTRYIWVSNFTSVECGRNKHVQLLDKIDWKLMIFCCLWNQGCSDVVFLATSKESTKKHLLKTKAVVRNCTFSIPGSIC